MKRLVASFLILGVISIGISGLVGCGDTKPATPAKPAVEKPAPEKTGDEATP